MGTAHVVFTCLDLHIPLRDEGLFGSLLPDESEIVLIRSAESLKGEPPSDGTKSLLTAVHTMDISTICVVRHSNCIHRKNRLMLGMKKHGINKSWLQNDAMKSWVKPIGHPERTLLSELEFLSSWSLIPSHVYLMGLLYHDTKGSYELISYRKPGMPLVNLKRQSHQVGGKSQQGRGVTHPLLLSGFSSNIVE